MLYIQLTLFLVSFRVSVLHFFALTRHKVLAAAITVTESSTEGTRRQNVTFSYITFYIKRTVTQSERKLRRIEQNLRERVVLFFSFYK